MKFQLKIQKYLIFIIFSINAIGNNENVAINVKLNTSKYLLCLLYGILAYNKCK